MKIPGMAKGRKRLRNSKAWDRLNRHRKTAISVFIIFAHFVGALTSVVAIMQTRTSQGAMAWAISLNTIPYVTVPAYWVFGQSKFNDYQLERNDVFEATNPIADLIRQEYLQEGLVTPRDTSGPLLLEKLARLPFTSYNSVDLLVDGEETFAAIFDAVDRATNYVLVQFYIVRDDELGRALRDKLVARARAGVRVFFLYDEIGSSDLPQSFVKSLSDAGVRVGPFNSTKGKANRFQLNFRNHRKIVVTDGREAFVGGLNVGDEYMGRDEEVGAWRDTHVHITGPAVQFAQLSFMEDWRWATGDGDVSAMNWDPEKATTATQDVLLIPSGPADVYETCALFYLSAINEARERLWIATPYFVPDTQMMSALTLAALRGVDVRVMVPKNNDSKLVQTAMYAFLEECERAGIKVIQYREGFMHQKVLLADFDVAAVGTANFDNRSFRLNFEIMAVVRDEEFNARVGEMLERDMAKCEPLPASTVTSASLPFQFAVKAARLLAPVL